MSLVTIVQGVCAQSNVPVPSSVIGNTDQNVVQMLTLLNREGLYFARAYDWTLLRKESSFTTLAANQQIADLTSYTDSASASVTDWDRFVPGTMWDRTSVRPINPMTQVEYQNEKARTAVGIFPRFIVRGKALLFSPAPSAGNTVYFEYISKNWCQTSGGTGKTAFSVDTDTGILNAELLTQAVLWRFLKAKGLDYAEEFRRCELMFSALTGQQMPQPDLMVGGSGDFGATDPYVPENGFG